MKSGKCAFTDKVYNAQEAGAKVAVIIDTSYFDRKVFMIDNGHGFNINITSVIIPRDYGEAINM